MKKLLSLLFVLLCAFPGFVSAEEETIHLFKDVPFGITQDELHLLWKEVQSSEPYGSIPDLTKSYFGDSYAGTTKMHGASYSSLWISFTDDKYKNLTLENFLYDFMQAPEQSLENLHGFFSAFDDLISLYGAPTDSSLTVYTVDKDSLTRTSISHHLIPFKNNGSLDEEKVIALVYGEDKNVSIYLAWENVSLRLLKRPETEESSSYFLVNLIYNQNTLTDKTAKNQVEREEFDYSSIGYNNDYEISANMDAHQSREQQSYNLFSELCAAKGVLLKDDPPLMDASMPNLLFFKRNLFTNASCSVLITPYSNENISHALSIDCQTPYGEKYFEQVITSYIESCLTLDVKQASMISEFLMDNLVGTSYFSDTLSSSIRKYEHSITLTAVKPSLTSDNITKYELSILPHQEQKQEEAQ